jgi:hypothetical protein
MKKLILYTALALWAFSAGSNPIILPYILINELYFEEGEWTLELAYFEANEVDYPIVEIYLTSTSGETQMLNFDITGEEGLILVQNNETISNPFLINNEGDIITLTWGIDLWGSIEYQESEMVFGEYPNSTVTKPGPGQSIANINYYYSKDNSPTLGQVNDTTGVMGTLWGTVFDMNLLPVPNESFYLTTYLSSLFITSNDGEYSLRVLSNIFNRNKISHILLYGIEMLNAEIHYIMEPDSVVNFDIYLLDSLTVGITEPSVSDKGIFRFYPNPVSRQLSINYEVNLPGNKKELILEIKSTSAVQIFTCPVSSGEGVIKLPEQIPSGVYLVNLLSGQKLLSSGRLVVSR